MREPSGNLSGRIVFTSGGHGWVLGSNWYLQRPVLADMVEDFGNLDQMNFFVFYCFNAGATVVPLRPVGFQTNEVVIDNTSASVSFSGAWTHIASETVYFGSPGSGFHQASSSTTETALVTFTPNIPVTGFYPVYTWVPHGANRTNQLYRIRHTGGESTVRIPHHMVGNGWVYLGTYYLNSGSNSASGSVAVSNLQPGANTNTVAIADAIRFGNGKSNSGSTYPREDEGARWWIQNSLGQGQSSSIYLSPGDVADVEDRKARPKMAAEMNRQQTGNSTKRLYVSFHSNATTGNTNTATARGTVALINNSNPTPRQAWFSANISKEVQDDLVSMNSQLEFSWFGSRGNTLGGPYVEIDYVLLNSEMDATLLEVAFHDNVIDAALLRDPKVRNWVARASYQSVVRYMTNYDGAAAGFLPEPPSNIRAIGTTNGVRIFWTPPVASGGSGSPGGYVVYRSTNGYGFGNPVLANSSATNLTVTGLAADTDYYFRVAAFNAAGESFPSETAGCRWTANTNVGKILFVNGFNRFDRTTNLRQGTGIQNYQPPGKTGSAERVMPRANNSFDYVVQHGKSINAYGLPFDSCHKQAVTNNLVALTNYSIVVWETGQDLTDNFNSVAQSRLTTFLNGNGNLFVSGSEIARSLDRASGPSTADRAFFNNYLHADLASDAHTNSASYNFVAVANSIFQGNANGIIDDGNKGIYWVKSPEVLTPFGTGSTAAINYSGGLGGAAAIQYDGSAGGGRVVYFGFPFETITSAAVRDAYMSDALNFLGSPRILTQPQNFVTNKNSNATFTVFPTGIAPLNFQWRLNGTNILNATNSTLSLTNVQPADAGLYSIIVSNLAGAITSSNATLTVIFPQPQFSSVTLSDDGDEVQFTLAGESGSNYQIQTSTNLIAWESLTNVVFTGDTFEFSDALTNSQRFYRAVHNSE